MMPSLFADFYAEPSTVVQVKKRTSLDGVFIRFGPAGAEPALRVWFTPASWERFKALVNEGPEATEAEPVDNVHTLKPESVA